MIACYTVPEMWHVTGVIVMFHFGLFFALLLRYHHFPHAYQKLPQDVQFMRYGARQTNKPLKKVTY